MVSSKETPEDCIPVFYLVMKSNESASCFAVFVVRKSQTLVHGEGSYQDSISDAP